MEPILVFVIIIILVALVFDYINGFHDAANSIATIVSTRVLSPGAAVVWAAFFNFIAFVICCVFFTDLMRRRMSKRFGITTVMSDE